MNIVEASSRGIPADVDETDVYMTEDGYIAIEFWYHRMQDNTWRVYIMSDIDYHGRDVSSSVSHTHSDDGNGYKHISYEAVQDKKTAKAVSADWADLTAHYIQTGTRF
ncbi:MAG: hypothetical protein LBJ48_00110 [Coriobacteriales bacterium]|jgi:hypothetical protein|nr:hypothetical protein [Coriobacteriales bacterium]